MQGAGRGTWTNMTATGSRASICEPRLRVQSTASGISVAREQAQGKQNSTSSLTRNIGAQRRMEIARQAASHPRRCPAARHGHVPCRAGEGPGALARTVPTGLARWGR